MKFFLISTLFVFIVDISLSQSLSELVTKGDSCISAKNTSIALQYYSRAIDLDSKCSMCYYKRGTVYAQEGYFTEAIQDLYYTSLLRVSQKDEVLEHTFFLIGECYSILNQPEKAVENYTNTLLLNPKNFEAMEARIYSLLGLKKFDQALLDIKRLQKISKDKSKVQMLLGNYYTAIHQLKKANKAFTKAILLKPSEGNYYVERGKLLGLQENYTDAILNFSKAIELDQNNDEALVQRGIAYHKVNNILAGCADFSRAAYLGNDEARVMLEAHCPH
jgi:tetratricopeptide (TPR) repeat protein